jgi:branched-subunit amino acid ABC-type transport system permease component
MGHFLGYASPGIPYGCTYALFAVGLVLTYQATGVFNFAFAAQAYASAFIFTLLTETSHLPVWEAFVISVVLLAPALGWAFDFFLFRHIPNTNMMAKVVTGISLLVGVPSILVVIFGDQNLYNSPSILFNPDIVYFHLFGLQQIPINGIFLSTVIVTFVVLVALVVLMRFTSLGLQMRAAVESRRLVQLDGINATRVVGVAWAVSSLLAGLAGVLLAPQFAQLQAENYITLMVTAIAAAAWGVLRSMPVAAGVAVVMGIVELTAEGYLPTGGFLYASVLPVLPMIVLVAALLLVPGMRTLEEAKDPLASVDPPTPPTAAASRSSTMNRIIRSGWWVLLSSVALVGNPGL